MQEQTFKEFLKELLDNGEDMVSGSLFHSDFNDEISKYDRGNAVEFKQALIDNKVTVEHLDNYGGEGCGDDYYSVYSFTNQEETLVVKFQGWYQSYNGSEFSEWFFAKAVAKTGFDYTQE
jgi:hypothetical protein